MNNGVDVLNLEHSADWIVKQLGLQSFEHLLQKPKSDAEYLKEPEALQSQDMRGQYQLGTSDQSQKMTQDVSQQRISEIDSSDSTKPSLSFEQIQRQTTEKICVQSAKNTYLEYKAYLSVNMTTEFTLDNAIHFYFNSTILVPYVKQSSQNTFEYN